MKTTYLKNTLLVSLCFLWLGTNYAQTVFRGTVIDKETDQPVSDAKVGITKQGVGVLSDAQGAFVYKKYEETIDVDSELVISAIGYKPIKRNASDIRSLWNVQSKIYLEPTSKKAKIKSPKNVVVFWDVSAAMRTRDVTNELRYLKAYVFNYPEIKIRLNIFNEEIVLDKEFDMKGNSWSAIQETLESVNYSGFANYDLLDTRKADAVLLFSNGAPLFGILDVQQDVPVYAVLSKKMDGNIDYLRHLGKYTSGRFDVITGAGETLAVSEVGAKEFKQTEKEIFKGKVMSSGKPLQGASVIVSGSFDEFITLSDGSFEIEASEEDILLVSHLGMFNQKVALSGNQYEEIDLLPENNVLDEVVLTAVKKKDDIYFEDGVLVIDKLKINGQMMHPKEYKHATSLFDAVNGKRAGVSVIKKDGIDRLVIRGEYGGFVILGGPQVPPDTVQMQDVERIFIFKAVGGGGAVVVLLKSHPLVVAARKRYNERLLLKNNNYTEDVAVLKDDDTATLSEIRGIVKGPQGGIQGATIVKKGSFDEYTSAADGSFTIPAQIGDQIHISYLGMHKVGFMVTDLETKRKVNMIPKNDVLDEVSLSGKKKQEEELISKGFGKVSIESQGFATHFLSSEDIPASKNGVIDILNGRFAGVRVSGIPGAFIKVSRFRTSSIPPAVVIDGVIFSQDRDGDPVAGAVPDVPAQDIKSITILKGVNAGAYYGPIASGGAVVIELKNGFTDGGNSTPKSLKVKGNDYEEELTTLDEDEEYTQISGTITGPQGTIQGASISRKGSFDEYTTDVNGTFSLPAKKGDVIMVSFLGMFPKAEVVQDVDALLNINLIPKSNVLDEVVLSGKGEGQEEELVTGFGKESKDKLGYDVKNINGKNIKVQHQYLSDVLRGQFAGVQVYGQGNDVRLEIRQKAATLGGANTEPQPIFVIDNAIIAETKLSVINGYVDPQNIENISILKSYAATNRYGGIAVDGAVVITTKTGSGKDIAEQQKTKSLLVAGNEYQAQSLKSIDASENLPEYILELQTIAALEDRYQRYLELRADHPTDIEFYVDMVVYFKKYQKSKAKSILSDLTMKGQNNVKVLRIAAYLYESMNDHILAQNVYKRILQLQPEAAQSYRDLALIYQETGAYNKALELYINMLGEQIKGVDFSGLEKPLRSELSRLVTVHKDKIEFSRLPNQWLKANFKIDRRMVIDWSDTTVPFEFQFVNPDKKFYKWTHTLEENRERLVAEQKQGFQTEEFIIDDAPAGEWLINIQYLGNEGDFVLPPFLKYTVYKDYGTPQETKKVRVIKIFRQLDKVTLGKVQL